MLHPRLAEARENFAAKWRRFAAARSASDRLARAAAHAQSHDCGMTDTATLHLLLLDEQWQPRRRVALDEDWRATMDILLRCDSSWLVIEQRRDEAAAPLPRSSDIRLTRSLRRRLRPMEIRIADHIIEGAQGRFSFREAGLL